MPRRKQTDRDAAKPTIEHREQDFFAFKVEQPPKSSKKTDTIFQLKITLLGTKPPIWRQVQVKDCTLARLHEIVQIAMGWEFSHLHGFKVAGEWYGDLEMGDDMDWKSDRKIKLSQIVEAGHRTFTYIYDMGDSWEHRVRVEKTVAPEPKAKYPRCINGARACPPEDCGGVWGYQDLLEAIGNKKHKEHDETCEWVGGAFDPEEFSVEAVNRELAS